MNLNLTLRQLRAFDAVAAEGSFTKAAQRLFLTQSALSVLVREMERELGIALFDRHTRRVELSEAGRDLYPAVRRMLNELTQAVGSVTDLRDKRKGVLRLAAPQLMACTLVPQVLASYRAQHPGVDIRLQDTLPEHLLDRVQSGEVELAIGPDGVLDEAGLQRRPFLRDRHWLVCHPEHALAERPSLRWQDLGRCRFIAPTRDFIHRMCSELGAYTEALLLEPVQEVSYFTTAFGLVSAGLGVTLCPTYARPLVQAYGLQMRPVQDPVFYREVCVYTQAHKALSPAGASLVECLDAAVTQLRFAEPIERA